MFSKRKILVGLAVLVMGAGVQAGVVLLEDDFSSGSLDAAKWDVKDNDTAAALALTNDAALFTVATENKAVGMSTVNTYDFSTTTLVFQATVNVANDGDAGHRFGFVLWNDNNQANPISPPTDNQLKLDYFASTGRLFVQTSTANVDTTRYDDNLVGLTGNDTVYRVEIDNVNMIVTVGGIEVYNGVHGLNFQSAAYFQMLNLDNGTTTVDDVSITAIPEPATMSLVVISGFFLFIARRFRA